MHSLKVLEARSLKLKCEQGHTPSGSSGGALLASFSFCRWPLAALVLGHLPLSACGFCVSLSPSLLLQTPATELTQNPRALLFLGLTYDCTGKQTLFPNEVPVKGTGDQDRNISFLGGY